MGKRKRRVNRPPIAPLSSPDDVPCSLGVDPLSIERPPNHISTNTEQPHSSTKDTMGSHEQQNEQLSMSHHQQHNHHHHHNNHSRSMYIKHSRNRGPHHHPGNQCSTYLGKNNPSPDNHVPFKVGNNRWNSESGSNTDGRERAFHKPERIRSTDKPMEIIQCEDEKMVCGTCEKLLRQKQPLGSSLQTNEVVAVLVCGHFFHAGCLELRTTAEEASDPPCPLCFKE